MSRNISDLSPKLQPVYCKWKELMDEAGIDILITCTSRTQAEQEALYAKGRTAPGPKVTWTLNSKHLTGEAFDFVIMDNGKPDWNMRLKDQWATAVLYGKQLGLSQVIGKDGKVKEAAHLQLGG